MQLDPEFNIKNSITMDTGGGAFRQMLLTPAGNIHILKQNYDTELYSLIEVDTLGNFLDEITIADNISISFLRRNN